MRQPIVLLSLLLVGLSAAPAHAIDYRLFDISGAGRFAEATAINNLGQVTGGSASGGFFYSRDTGLLRLDDRPPAGAPAGAALQAWGIDINDSGEVVGRWHDGASTRGFTYTLSGGMRDLGRANIEPTSIDHRGWVAGMTTPSPDGSREGFYTTGGHSPVYTYSTPAVSVVGFVDFGALTITNFRHHELGDPYTIAGWGLEGGGADLGILPPNTGTYATDNTADSTVVGYFQLPMGEGQPPGQRAFAYTQIDGIIDLGPTLPANAARSFATAVNNVGQVVGGGQWADGAAFSFLYDLPTRSFLDLATVLDPLTSAGWSSLALNDLNDLGQIVGTGLFNGQPRAFMLAPTGPMAPVPEPGIWLMLALGTVGVAGTVRRRSGRPA